VRAGVVGQAPIISFALVLLGSLPVNAASARAVSAAARSNGAVTLTFDDGWNRACGINLVGPRKLLGL
jgi:hypothetical protein